MKRLYFFKWGNSKEGKVHLRTGHEGPEGSSTLSLTSALDGVDGQHHAADALPLRVRDPVSILLDAGGSQGRLRRVWKISPLPGFDLRTAQPVASKQAHLNYIHIILILNFM